MLPEGLHVRSAYLDSSTGILGPDMVASLLVDCSTIDTKTSLRVAKETWSRNLKASFYDAPMSGGTQCAEAASLTFTVGCTDDGSDVLYPLLNEPLSLMGKTVVACAGPGIRLTAKLCNKNCPGLVLKP